MTTDFVMKENQFGNFDFVIENGDFKTGNFFDSSILYALFGEKRASESEVEISSRRRGWIGNEGKGFENGSKLWLFEQERITRSVLNDIQNTAIEALNYLVFNEQAQKIEAQAFLKNNFVVLEITIFVTQSRVETRVFELWENTGLL